MSVNYGDLECSPHHIARQEAAADYMSPRERKRASRLKEIDREIDQLTGRFLSEQDQLRLRALHQEAADLEYEEDSENEAAIWKQEREDLEL